MLSCAVVTRICSDEMDRRLKLGEQAGMRMHLMICPGCTEYRRQLQVLRQAMQHLAQGKAPAGDAGDRPGDPPRGG